MASNTSILEISPELHWVGVKDWDREMFDRLIPLPMGTTYNSYLIQGKEKTVLIDTVNPGFEDKLEDNIRKIIDPSEIDYIVMNHAEPDHANAIPHILALSKKAKIITTKKGEEMAKSLHFIPKNRIKVVEDQETIDLGGKTLRFIYTPWLHWPETMMTFYEDENTLFSCDFFGTHLASNKFFDDEFGDEIIQYAKIYFGEIMMPFRKMADNALDKLEDLNIEMIAPSHGPIYRTPDSIINAYRKWTKGSVDKKVLIIYISMWGSTAKMIKTLINSIRDEDIPVKAINLASIDVGEIVGEIVDSAGVIVGTPTVLGGPHPTIQHIIQLAKKLNPPTRLVGVIESHGWAGGAVGYISKCFENTESEIVGALEVLGRPSDEDMVKVMEFGKEFVDKVKSLN